MFGLAILEKALLILAASLGHELTYLPGLVGSLGSAGCIPYRRLWDLGGRKNWSMCSPPGSDDLEG